MNSIKEKKTIQLLCKFKSSSTCSIRKERLTLILDDLKRLFKANNYWIHLGTALTMLWLYGNLKFSFWTRLQVNAPIKCIHVSIYIYVHTDM